MKKVVHDSNQPFIYLCNKCNSICSIQIFNSYQTKICIDCNDMDEEIISIQDYLERIKNLSKEGNKCEKHEINALDICLNCQKWMCNKCKNEHLRNKKYKQHLFTHSIIEFLSKCPYHMKNYRYYCKDCDENFCEFIGIWLAEGSWNRNQISFTISIKEDRLKERILFLGKKVFGLNGTVYIRKNNSQAIYFNSSHLSAFFKQIFCCNYNEINQWNKWIPSQLLFISPKKQLQIVKGWLDGDGHYRKTNNCHRYKGTTVSNILIEGMKNILYRNFVNPSITIEEREKKHKVYNLNFNGLLAKEFKDAIDNNRPVVINNQLRLSDYYPKKINNQFYMINKVRSIKKVKRENEMVYCLEMPNGSFNVNGVEGHNCRAFSKTFISILALYLECMFRPGVKLFICAPGKNQSAKIAKDKIYEIWDKLPFLKKEIIGDGNFGKDYVKQLLTYASVMR